MKRLLSVAVIALLPLFALEECDRSFIPVPAGDPAPISQPVQPAARPLAPGADRMPMLQDPEETFDEHISVYADSPAEAQRKCENVARERSSGAIATCLGCRLMTTAKTGRFGCNLRIEPRKQP